MENLYQEFISRLKKLYGSFDEVHKKFEKSPNSAISRDLGYSDAQFSRLINESATEGEYARANQNAQRILTLLELEQKLKDVKGSPPTSYKKRVLSGIVIGIISLVIGYGISSSTKPATTVKQTRYDMLRWAFESNFIKPYKGLRDLPADCNFECYKYQGRWELKNEYKLPFLRESSGFHYLAKSVVSYIRCTPEKNPDGNLMQGFEYQEHEIWYDLLERPISMFIKENGDPLPSYEKLVFSKSDEFIKIGTIHSFYTNDFTLESLFVFRHGQDIGRDIEFVSDNELAKAIDNKVLLEKIQKEMIQIVQDPLKDFSKPSQCDPSDKPSDDFHDINNGDEMAFHCQMSTAGRFPINYTKTYILQDQFIKDKCLSRVD